jgi:hypothetical protein
MGGQGIDLSAGFVPADPNAGITSALDRFQSRRDIAAREQWMRTPHGGGPAPFMGQGESERFKMHAGTVIPEALPVAGMTVGSIAGGAVGGPPGAMVGSMALGAAGEYGRQKLEDEETSPGKIYDVGVGSGLAETGGALLTKGVTKGLEAVAGSSRANILIDRLLKPSVKKLILGTKTKVDTADAIASEVNKVAGNAHTLPQLKTKVDSAIEDLTIKTQKIVDSYAPQYVESSVSPAAKAGGAISTPGEVLPPASRMLTSGASQLTAGSEIAAAGKPALTPSEIAAVTGRTATPSAAGGTPTVKMFTKQGGIPLRSILRASANKTANELSETEVANKNKVVARLAQMIYQHAGKPEITPSEALQLRRWLYSSVKWPKAALGMRDDIYSALNRQIEVFLQPEDAAAFKANNASVHKLLRARDAIDLRSLEQNRRGVHLTHRWWVLPLVGSSAGGALGYAAGGGKGAAEGAGIGAGIGELGSLGFGMAESPGGLLAQSAVSRTASKAAQKALPLAKKAAQTFFGTQP